MVYPTKYNPQTAQKILELYASGKTMVDIGNMKDMPTRYTVVKWRIKYPEFGALYDEALLSYSECIIEEALNIADTETDAKKAKNRIDIRTWIASKYNRARFGDKIEIEQTVKLDISPALKLAMSRMSAVKPLTEVVARQIE